MKEKLLVGWKETLDLPELGIYGIEAKVDTGAASSVLHCNSYKVVKEDGQDWIICELIINFETEETKTLKLKLYKTKLVKSSFGQEEKRFYIRTTATLYDQVFGIKISFRNRSQMTYPMLLGKNFLYKRFLVDVSKENLSVRALAK
ncbi:ATP-dependent zinc protease family protein [Sphingobacterium siyangense]|uniref:ATP-dependent zinc protease family protein n=1 Tax=Sphingobacterium siyangense TaxID=459529 RepID=UPI0019631C48|nr:RimK/LysX family protein [Sphingobacterium siyangense]QRY60170.1 ATP-dependent zinc protease [Sphingobacterium siyangense]